MLQGALASYGFTYDNWPANPASTAGTSVTPGTSNAEGTYTQIASGSNIAQDCYWLWLCVHTGATNANQKDHLLDIGVDNAGGTSYTTVVANLMCGETGILQLSTNGHREFLLPLFIKSGSTVAVRVQGNNASAGSVRVMAKFWGQPDRPECVPQGLYSETIGAITNSGGVSFTPGNAADGTWASIGTTTQSMWWWQFSAQCGNGTITGLYTYVDFAYGDATNKIIVTRQLYHGSSAEICSELIFPSLVLPGAYHLIPGGSTLYVRGRCDSAPNSGWTALAVGIGG